MSNSSGNEITSIQHETACSITDASLTAWERERLLYEWNATQAPYSSDSCLHHLFEIQVAERPEAIAVTFEEHQLTYLELNQRANQLAHHLQTMGVGPEVLVGIYLERSQQLPIAVLGILKAGGAYLPLDPTYPPERLAFLLQETQAPVLVTQQSLSDALLPYHRQVVCLDRQEEISTLDRQSNLNTHLTPTNLAYVIYTSGSTGKPKGVKIQHGGVCNLVEAKLQGLLPQPGDRVLQFAALTFDASVWETFIALMRGACLVLAQKAQLLPGPPLLQFLREQAITCTLLPPSTLAILPHTALPDLRVLFTGGEACPASLVVKWAPGRTFYNAYGPTEATVYATTSVCSGEDKPSIGRPIANARVYLLDSQGQPVPVGVQGELFIGGAGLARGYLKHPELTAERFVPDPFSGQAGARLYRTGDQARYHADGTIEFLGRLDQQIKLRGFRIELGEIEAALSQHPSVREVAVIVQETAAHDKRLIAYVALHPTDEPLTAQHLRTYLREQMPEYLVPARIVLVEHLPITAHGKIDRQALLLLDSHQPQPESTRQAAHTPIQQAIARIWTEVLEVEQVGLHDNFFDLGGHSLLVTQVISRLQDTFQVELSFRTIFDAPIVADLATQVERALQSRSKAPLSVLKPMPRTQKLPLSFAQQRLWFLDQLTPGNPVYNEPCALHLSGLLHISALEQSLNEIVRRHEILRTTFIAEEGHPKQIIASSMHLPLPVIDLTGLEGNTRKQVLVQLTTTEARRPFDLTHGPLIRSTLLRSGDAEYVLVLLLHHIISDGWSNGVLIRELSTLYTAYSTGAPSPLPELLIQYADFALWQRNRLQGADLEKQMAYWRRQLAGMSTLLELPTDHPRPSIQQFRGTQLFFTLPAPLCAGIKRLSQQEGLTLFMTLLAAYQTLLFRYSNQQDIVVGVPIANRNRSEIEPLIGFFVNTLIMRTWFADDLTVHDLLARIREVALGAFEHQEVPFERLVEELQPERTPGYSPLFQVAFALQNAPAEALELAGLKSSPMMVENGTAKFDLTLFLWEQGDTLTGTLEYNTDLFDETTIQRMVGHFQSLLAVMVAQPEQRLADLPLLTEAELQLLAEWNRTQMAYPEHDCIHTLIEEQVERTPDTIAVTLGSACLTYRTLNTYANQLAHYLRQHGVGPEVPVGLCLERSLPMLIGLLGILKAGGVYLPLDPEYPAERLHFILNDAQVPVLLTQQSLINKLPEHQARKILLDTDWPLITLESEANPTNQTTPTNLAYVIYTSGSTGLPKGGLLLHQGLCALTEAQKQIFQLQGCSRVLQFASAGFDASIWEIFMALRAGATLCLGRKDDLLAGTPLFHYLREQAITTVTLPPTLLAQLEMDLPVLETIVSAGEACPSEVATRWLSHHRFFNAYGPTETTVCASIELCQNGDQQPSIGRPLPGTEIYILDTHLHPVPIGVPGEIYIGGVSLARGYLHRPHTTAERFIPHPFVGTLLADQLSAPTMNRGATGHFRSEGLSEARRASGVDLRYFQADSDVVDRNFKERFTASEPGARLYKTGDRARYLSDGTIEYLGRLDQQVKLRGFRIELGEIEAVLRQHPTVREAAVIVQETAAHDKRLTAYVALHPSDDPLTAQHLRSYLRQHLPEYLVPARIVLVEHLPLTAHGKIDRRALLLLDSHELQPESTQQPLQQASHTPMQQSVARIWAEVLEVEQVGLHDNFFDLGGHSLLVTQVISRLQNALQVELPITDLFDNPTVYELTAKLEQIKSTAKTDTARKIQPLKRGVRNSG